MKIEFDKLCTCSKLQGYDSMWAWWELNKKLNHEMNLALLYGDLQKAFDYQQVLLIIIQDGKTKMKDCEHCNEDKK